MRPALARRQPEPFAHRRIGRVEIADAAALGVLESDGTDRWKLDLARVVQDQRDDVVLVRKCAKRRLEVEIKKVRDYEDHVALLRHVREVVRDARDLRRRAARLGEQELTYDVEQVMTSLLRRDELADSVGEQDQADVPVPWRRRKHGGHYGTATLSRTRPMTISGVISSASAS